MSQEVEMMEDEPNCESSGDLSGNNETGKLVMDESAYRLYHQARTGAPCLSFDIIQDDLGNNREVDPFTMYIVSGTQAPKTHVNNLLLIKMSNLHGIKQKNDSSDDESSDDESEQDTNVPIMSSIALKHKGCVNRIRSKRFGDKILAASWSELGRVHLWDLSKELKAIDDESPISDEQSERRTLETPGKPIFSFKGHPSEGYALDWSNVEQGYLASGDCKGNIHVWNCKETWSVSSIPFTSHSTSVEDIQWSPNEKNVFASCSVDKSIKIWDIRAQPHSACMLTASEAHSSDINVISWNKIESQYLISGGDDGLVKLWDLRQFASSKLQPLATFTHHSEPITTLEWHPHEATVFASGAADDQIVQWDLSIEVDETKDEVIEDLPPQLLFIHQGQSDIKELHWHPQCTGIIISTALTGINVFRTISA
ncbi:hypothetical protein TKK_0001880 [Trichogramma kaykai]|uniref:Glutamate-rich WD repeat-containing protein 1 n=1 Tax=Trichogramma kaykai TaxID=54128 RepID=A0ABD2XGJ3_9HYME